MFFELLQGAQRASDVLVPIEGAKHLTLCWQNVGFLSS